MRVSRSFVGRCGALALVAGAIGVNVVAGGQARAAATAGVIDVRIANGADDVEQRGSGRMSADSTDLEMAIDGSTTQGVGLRYTGLAIPAGATITEAWVQFTVDETGSKATALSIVGHASDNSPAFTSAKLDLSSRPATTAAVQWTPAAWPTDDVAGAEQRTPSLAGIIQEIVSRPGWAPGGAVSLQVAGTGTRTAQAYESDAAESPLLHIAYSAAVGTPPPTTVSPTTVPVTTVPVTTVPVTSVPPPTIPATTTPVTTIPATVPATTTPVTIPPTTIPVATTLGGSGSSGYAGPLTGASGSIVAGTYVESPNRIGPFADRKGNLYFVIELPEALLTPWMRIVKSSDGGRTWAEVDAANRPSARDLESVDIQQDKATGTLYVLQQRSGGAVYYHEFHTSDHASSPDRWGVNDEQPGSPASPTEQMVAIGHRSNGTTIAVYAAMDGSEQHLAVRVRSAGGVWSAQAIVDKSVGSTYDVVGIMTTDDVYHLWYSSTTTGKLYFRTFSASGAVSAAQVVASDLGTGSSSVIRGPILPPVAYTDASGRRVVVVGYSTAAGIIKTVTYVNGAVTRTDIASDRAVARDRGTSRQPVASLANDGSTLYLVYADASTLDIWTDRNVAGAGWEADLYRIKGVTAHWIRAGVLVHSKSAGRRVLGWIWDTGSDGHVGDSRYDEVTLA